MNKLRELTATMQAFSLPLIAGVFAALVVANIDSSFYKELVHSHPFGEDTEIFGRSITLEFLINEVFMVLFFGIAAKEITASVLPGGALNPVSKAINPIMGTVGGVLGPAGLYLLLTLAFYGGDDQFSDVANGWGIPTATDIALVWLVARLVFGSTHPAVTFLLLLAVADDAIGLGIIAVFYPDPDHPVEVIWLLLTAAGMAAAFVMRRAHVGHWLPYILIGGVMSWIGMLKAGIEPALALVVIVPFLPASGPSQHRLAPGSPITPDHDPSHSPLMQFEHRLKLTVDIGLFFFAFANAGVAFGSTNSVTWIVLMSLIIGKTIGISTFSLAAHRLGFPLPSGMDMKHLVVTGMIAGLGLTVALFVAGKAFPEPPFDEPAKMGAVLSILVGFVALAVGRILKLKDEPSSQE